MLINNWDHNLPPQWYIVYAPVYRPLQALQLIQQTSSLCNNSTRPLTLLYTYTVCVKKNIMRHLHGSQLQKFTRSDLHVLNVYHFTQLSFSLSLLTFGTSLTLLTLMLRDVKVLLWRIISTGRSDSLR